MNAHVEPLLRAATSTSLVASLFPAHPLHWIGRLFLIYGAVGIATSAVVAGLALIPGSPVVELLAAQPIEKPVQAAPDNPQPDIPQIADTMVRLCVGGGRTQAASAGGTGGADLSLRSLNVKGKLQGEFKVSKSSAELLVNGIENAMSQVAADQADKVRVCLQPVRERLLAILLPPATGMASLEHEPAIALPKLEDAQIIDSKQVGLGGKHLAGLHKCSVLRNVIACSFVITNLERVARDYNNTSAIGAHPRLVDDLHVEHHPVRSYYVNGKGQHQEKINLATDDSVWFVAEFENGSNDISAARIVSDGTLFSGPVK